MCFWLCLIGVVGSCFPGVREKLIMAWRHRSSTEKCQLGVIGFLAFALCCFIIAVVVMDRQFKKKIHKLEDELDALKTTEDFNTTTPITITSTPSVTTTPSTKHTTTPTAKTTTETTTITTTTSTSTEPTTSTVPTPTSSATTTETTSPTTSTATTSSSTAVAA